MSAKSLGAAGALAAASPLAAVISGCSQQPLDSGIGRGPTTVTIHNSPNNVYSFPFSQYPDLQNPGGSIKVTIEATSGTKDVYVTRIDTTTVVTVSTICTHAGCTINPYDSSAKDYLCPCHGSVFGSDGSVIVGPAVVPLPTYPSVLTSTSVDVTVT